uniref:Uncharacterized protein n=1 Tax=Anguilla anguilla TaxID=7936 RepID=A0A0E9X2Y6_ANGAN
MEKYLKKNVQLFKILGLQLWLEQNPAYTGGPRTEFENYGVVQYGQLLLTRFYKRRRVVRVVFIAYFIHVFCHVSATG